MARRRTLLLALSAVLVVPASAEAAQGTCAYDGISKTATYTWAAVHLNGTDPSPAVIRDGTALNVGTSQCGVATVTNTDKIVFAGTPPPGLADDIVVDLGAGPLGPGADPEPQGISEIEIEAPNAVGDVAVRVNTTGGDDHIVAGTGGINLNAAEAVDDVDLTVGPNAALRIGVIGCLTELSYSPLSCSNPSAGADTYSVAGDPVTGGPLPYLNGFAPHRLVGGPGDDTLTVGLEGEVEGGTGDDTLTAAPEPVPMPSPVPARPWLDYRLEGQGVTVNLATGVVTGPTIGTDTIATSGWWQVLGTPHADVVVGGSLNDLVSPGEGDDTVSGGVGNDNVSLEAGDDEFEAGPGDDVVSGGGGNDTLAGGDGNDSLSPGDGTDELEGGPGNDVLSGAPPDVDDLDGGPGDDTVLFGAFQAGVSVDLATSPATLGGAATGWTAANFENIVGTFFGDTLRGTDGPNSIDVLSSPDGSDLAEGRGGADVLQLGGFSGGTADGGAGADTITGSLGDNDLLRGGADGAIDTLDCVFGENDRAVVDVGLDVVQNCDVVIDGRPAEEPKTPVTTTTTGETPPPAPPTAPPASVPPAPTPRPSPPAARPALAASTLGFPPASRRCLSRRSFPIRLREPAGVRLTKARVVLRAGKKRISRSLTPRRAGGRLTLTVDLRGLPKGRFTIDVTATAADGRTVKGTRSYRTCAPKRSAKRRRA